MAPSAQVFGKGAPGTPSAGFSCYVGVNHDFFFFLLFRAAPKADGSSEARG